MAYFKILLLLFFPLIAIAQEQQTTVNGYLAQQLLQHPLLSGPFQKQFYFNLNHQQPNQQIIVIHPEDMIVPTQANIPIEITGNIKNIDLGGKSGTKNAYQNQVMYLSDWHYLKTAEYEPCWYQAKATKHLPEPEFSEHRDCTYSLPDGKLAFNPNHLKSIEFTQYQLASFNYKGQFFYLNKKGQSRSVINYDNWADDFNDSLARTQINGKIGFFNQQLELVIPAKYDWAFSFENGQASVCIDCKLIPMGEHKSVSGGLWGKINLSGKLIEPLTAKND